MVPVNTQAPTRHRPRSVRECGSSRSPPVAAGANPAGSAVSTAPAVSVEEPRVVSTTGTSTSGPNSTR
ncbi:hypothetical protein ACFYTG_32280 [Streptomyces mirabilis]|uniref:hypothetical protein n=1 Tax=Streptomyces mirabilis TaxID=68239 RepID=UPI0036AB7058